MSFRLERAHLDEATANKIRSLEQESQCRVVALEAKVRLAELSHDQFVRLERVEKELGVSLVGIEPRTTIKSRTSKSRPSNKCNNSTGILV
jgi:hypothetical protein